MKNQIKLAILHGSQVTKKTHPNSDWDVAILAKQKLNISEIADLKEIYAKKFNVSEDSVDISDLNSDSPLLNFQVASNGKLLEGTQTDYIKFQLLSWKDYLNNQEVFELRNKFLEKHLA